MSDGLKGTLIVYGALIIVLLLVGIVRARVLRVRYLDTAYPFVAMLLAVNALAVAIAHAFSGAA